MSDGRRLSFTRNKVDPSFVYVFQILLALRGVRLLEEKQPFQLLEEGEELVSKWADYGVFRVRHKTDGVSIEKLEVAEDKGGTFGPKMVLDQLLVISKIDSGKTFVTVTGSEGRYSRGAELRVVTIRKTKFLRTDPNTTGDDNLSSLPTF